MAQLASRSSVDLHTQLFFKDRVSIEEAFVLFVRRNALQVLIPKYGIEGNIFLRETTSRSKFNEEEMSITIGDVTFKVFSKIRVQIKVDTSASKYRFVNIMLMDPYVPGLSVDEIDDASSVNSLQPEFKKLRTA
ncbi:exosome complex exonuclease RRP44-like [Xenia sp. Carnegie-2017]|uniref:exosome complex exonuclease RRP44-like n=1 Tax=Xenia sp. Carnegie-2017 TaxID=2897299 RepID=UPI001F044AC9|nr:exosome complex exonuclease RRP44-like [Xenia sp. Carnegie-2017]